MNLLTNSVCATYVKKMNESCKQLMFFLSPRDITELKTDLHILMTNLHNNFISVCATLAKEMNRNNWWTDRPTDSETDRRTAANKYDLFSLLQTRHKILGTNANRIEFILHFNSKRSN